MCEDCEKAYRQGYQEGLAEGREIREKELQSAYEQGYTDGGAASPYGDVR